MKAALEEKIKLNARTKSALERINLTRKFG
jgi:hypothetical protein